MYNYIIISLLNHLAECQKLMGYGLMSDFDLYKSTSNFIDLYCMNIPAPARQELSDIASRVCQMISRNISNEFQEVS